MIFFSRAVAPTLRCETQAEPDISRLSIYAGQKGSPDGNVAVALASIADESLTVKLPARGACLIAFEPE